MILIKIVLNFINGVCWLEKWEDNVLVGTGR